MFSKLMSIAQLIRALQYVGIEVQPCIPQRGEILANMLLDEKKNINAYIFKTGNINCTFI